MENADFSFTLNDPFIQSCIKRLKMHPKRIVFPEGEDLRVLQVAEKLVKLEIGVPILLGNRERIAKLAEDNGVHLTFVGIIDPNTSSDLELFCKRLEKIEKYKGMHLDNAQEMISHPLRFAAMMVQYGQADGYVGGNKSKPTTVFRALQQLVKPDKKVPQVFALTLLSAPHLEHFGREGHLMIADTAINPDPDIPELSAIALSSANLVNRLFEVKPRVVFLSHSTKSSNPTPSALKVAAAAELTREIVRKEKLDIEIDGELQADVALDPLAAERKAPHMEQKGAADALVFPNLDSAHISSKLLQHTAGAHAYGQFILGLDRPAAQVPVTTSADSLLGTSICIAIEAISANERFLDRMARS